MDIQNLEMPLVLFKDAADRVFDHANGIDVIDAVMRRYSDYAYLIRDIQAVRNVEMLEELKETYTDPDLYDPADDLRDLRLAVTLLMAACDFYRTITTKEKTNRPEHPQVSKFAYDALEKNYETLKRMFETEKLTKPCCGVQRPSRGPGPTNNIADHVLRTSLRRLSAGDIPHRGRGHPPGVLPAKRLLYRPGMGQRRRFFDVRPFGE